MSYLLFSSKCTSEMEFERPTMYAGGFRRMVSKMIASVNGKSLMDSNVNSVCAIIVSESGSLQLSSSSMTSSAIVHSSCSFSKGIFFNLLEAKMRASVASFAMRSPKLSSLATNATAHDNTIAEVS